MFRKLVRVTTDWKDPVKLENGSVVPHNGIDYGTVDLKKSKKKEDREVFVRLDGEVTNVRNLGSLGWGCKVYSPSVGQTDYYLHLESIIVKEGQKVKEGQVIGYTGIVPNAAYSEHSHIQTRKGRESGGVYVIRMDSNSINPMVWISKSKIKGSVPVVPKPTEPMVTINESEWQEKLTKIMELESAVKASRDLITIKNQEIEDERVKTQNEQDLKHLYKAGLDKVSKFLGVVYNINETWDLQRYKYEEWLQKVRERAIVDAVSDYIRRLIEKVRELLNKFKKK